MILNLQTMQVPILMKNKIICLGAVVASFIILLFVTTVLAGTTEKQRSEAVANIDYFSIAQELVKEAGGNLDEFSREAIRGFPRYQEQLNELKKLTARADKLRSTGTNVPRKIRRSIKRLTSKIIKTEMKAEKFAKSVSNSSFSSAGLKGLGKVLEGAGNAQIVYQAIDKANEGYQKGGVPRASLEAFGSYTDNTFTGEAVAYGASVGGLVGGPLGIFVGGIGGLIVKYGSDEVLNKMTGENGGLQGAIGKLGENLSNLDEALKLLDAWEKERQSLTALSQQTDRMDAVGLQKQITERRLGSGYAQWRQEEAARLREEERKRKAQYKKAKEWEKAEAEKKMLQEARERIEAERKKLQEAQEKLEAERKRLEEERKKSIAEAAAKKKAEANEESWGKGSYGEDPDVAEDAEKKAEKEKNAWGDGEYEETGSADNYIRQISAANAACDYHRALDLANRAIAENPENTWLKQNLGTIQLLVKRSDFYFRQLNIATNALKAGNYSASVNALNTAMQNASTQCGQDAMVRNLHEQAIHIVEMKKNSIIEKARWEAESSAYERDRARQRYDQNQADRMRDARALQGALLGVLRAVNQGGGSGHTGSGYSTGYNSSTSSRTTVGTASRNASHCQSIINEMNSLASQTVSAGNRHAGLGSADRQTLQNSAQNLSNLKKRQDSLMARARSMGCL